MQSAKEDLFGFVAIASFSFQCSCTVFSASERINIFVFMLPGIAFLILSLFFISLEHAISESGNSVFPKEKEKREKTIIVQNITAIKSLAIIFMQAY